MNLFFTGQSGSGKTTMALFAYQYFLKRKVPCIHIDGDTFRKIFYNSDYSNVGRSNAASRLYSECDHYNQQNINTVCSLILPHQQDRDMLLSLPNSYLIYCYDNIVNLKKRCDNLYRLEYLDYPYEEPKNYNLILKRTDSFFINEERLGNFLSYKTKELGLVND